MAQFDKIFEILMTSNENDEYSTYMLDVLISELSDTELKRCLNYAKKHQSTLGFFYKRLMLERDIRKG